jgi:NADP-dependent 3-hydroxy acid dehydrogenase YdfG
MKIAITGHKHGIGKAFAEQLSERGHHIVGISRSDGENIRRIPHTASLIEPCDMFINNAQTGFAQTELLYEVWGRWKGQDKYIWNISTKMTERPVNSTPDGQDDLTMSQYRTQKIALEQASRQLRFKSSRPQISIIKPGGVATQENIDNTGKANTDLWVKSILDTFCHNDNISISEITVDYTDKRIPL